VAQIVFSLVLLVCARLFIRTLRNLEKEDVGYMRKGLLLIAVDSKGGGYNDAQVNRLTRGLLEGLREIPGVQAATVSENGLFSGTDSQSVVEVEGYTATRLADKSNSSDRVGPNYFEVVGARVTRGRGIGPQDAENTAKVAVVNEKMADFYFPNRDPLGRHIFDGEGKDRVVLTIVGVVRDIKQSKLRESIPRRFYTAYLQHDDRDPIDAINLEIRTRLPSSSVAAAVRRKISEVNPNLPILSVENADGLIDDTLVQEHVIAELSSFFGGLALTLAAIGLFGVMSYITARRTMEIGIRFALGAERSTVIRMVLNETFRLVFVGLAVGIVLSVFASRLFAKSLFGVSPFDPATSAIGASVIAVAAAIAAYLPAWRASRVDPVVALRYE
jgi:putative ABC transport system permease protein